MGRWVTRFWENTHEGGLRRRDRRSGEYRAYVPDPLVGAALVLSPSTEALAARAEARVRALGALPDMAGIARFLLRSEAIASSRIEGVAPSAHRVALAELAQQEEVRGLSEQARAVARNVTLVRAAVEELSGAQPVTADRLLALHRSLLPDSPEHHGIRSTQNWVGGSSYHPLDADFVPPPPELVPDLVADLLTYLNGATHAPLIQAALVHAQFETIHPFADGNGRVGRALIHTVLTRRGLLAGMILPTSLVLSTLSGKYVEALSRFREAGDPGGSDAESHRPDAPTGRTRLAIRADRTDWESWTIRTGPAAATRGSHSSSRPSYWPATRRRGSPPSWRAYGRSGMRVSRSGSPARAAAGHCGETRRPCGSWRGCRALVGMGVTVPHWKEAGGMVGKQIRPDSHHAPALPHLEATLHPICSVLQLCSPSRAVISRHV